MANTSLVTNYFNLHNAKQFRESISETSNSIYYVFAGRHTPYSGGDEAIPNITNSNDQVNIDPYKKMVFGKRVSNNDVKIMVPRYDWVSNTIYAKYNDSIDLSSCNFYAVVNAVSNYYVFKVLDNNSNSPSTIQPNFQETAADDEFYSTSDGYIWKYMYTIDKSTFEKFATDDFIPVVPDANVQANAVSGSIDVITINYAGSNYNTYLSNTFISSDLTVGGDVKVYAIANNASTSNSFYINSFLYIKEGKGLGQIKRIADYRVIGTQKLVTLESEFSIAPDSTSVYEITPSVTITGDGSGAVARALVNTAFANTVYKIEIINKGANYTYATALVVGNTGGVSNSANLSVILGPKGGHGKDPEIELGGKYLGISVSFSNTESGTIPVTNDYRTIGLLKDPLYANVTLALSSPTGIFLDNELVTQSNSGAYGYVTEASSSSLSITNAYGIFLTSESVTGASSGASANVSSYQISGQVKDFSTFDNRYKFAYSGGFGTFKQDELVYYEAVSVSNAYYHSNDSNYYYFTDLKGAFNLGQTIIGTNSSASITLNTSIKPDIVEGSGEVLYIENIDPIQRDNSQSEIVKIILKF